jgi:hypothetical protein
MRFKIGIIVAVTFVVAMTASAANALQVAVPGTANLWLAGQPDGTMLANDRATENSPSAIFIAGSGGGLSISFEVSGLTSYDPNLELIRK